MRPVRATISLSKRTTCLIASHCQVPNVGPTFGPVYGPSTLAHWSYLTPLCDLRPYIFLAKCHVVNVLHRPYMNRMGQDIPPQKLFALFALFANVKNTRDFAVPVRTTLKICSQTSKTRRKFVRIVRRSIFLRVFGVCEQCEQIFFEFLTFANK